MSKKMWLSILSALMIAAVGAAWWPVSAQAQGGEQLGRRSRPRQAVGQVTAVSADAISLQTLKGDEVTFRIDADTRVRNLDNSETSLDDVQVDDWVRVAPVRGEPKGSAENQPLARVIVLLPEDFDPANAKAGRGKVTAVDVAGNSFTLETRRGESLVVRVNDATVYKGEVSALADIEVGMTAGLAGAKQANGELLASVVRAGYPRVRRMGEVSAVDPAAGQFTLKLRRDGTEITVAVDDNTRFRSKDDVVDALEDLQPGMKVIIQGKEQPGGITLARVVLVQPNR